MPLLETDPKKQTMHPYLVGLSLIVMSLPAIVIAYPVVSALAGESAPAAMRVLILASWSVIAVASHLAARRWKQTLAELERRRAQNSASADHASGRASGRASG